VALPEPRFELPPSNDHPHDRVNLFAFSDSLQAA